MAKKKKLSKVQRIKKAKALRIVKANDDDAYDEQNGMTDFEIKDLPDDTVQCTVCHGTNIHAINQLLKCYDCLNVWSTNEVAL